MKRFFAHLAISSVAILAAVIVYGGHTQEAATSIPPIKPAVFKPTPPTSSVVQFQSDQAKQQFVQANGLSADEIKPVPNSNSYVVEKTPTQIQPTSGTTAQPNYVYHAMLTPNDPLYPQWYTTKISAPAGWDVTTGSSSVTIAILDTGFDLTHDDMAGRFVAGYDFINNDSDPSINKSSLAGTCAPNDLRFHGTATAGLLGATGNNGTGVASLDWGSKIMPIEVLDDTGCGTTASVVAGINFAVANGANIISMSLGQTSNDSTLQTAIDNAVTAGVTVVAAAGNCGGSDYANNSCDFQGQMVYPANYPEVIAVGATDINDNRASYSSYGPNLDVMAPGDASGSGSDVMRTPFWDSTNPNAENEYTLSLHGTSFATPVAAGLAALIKSQASSATPAQIQQMIEGGADKVAGMNGQPRTDQYGYGRVNAQAVLSSYHWSFNSQASYTDSTKATPLSLNGLSAGQTAWLVVKANNTGDTIWQQNGVNQVDLATDRSAGRSSRFATGAWLSPSTPAKMDETSVAPGGTATFEFPIQVPAGAGTFDEYFNPVAQDITYLNDDVGQYFGITVNGDYHWSFSSQASYTDSGKGTALSLNNLSPGQTAWLVVKANNTGNAIWYQTGSNQVDLATDRGTGRSSRFATGAWLSPNTPARMDESSVAPGQTATFEFSIQVPPGGGTFNEYFNPVAQNITYLNNDVGQYFGITVNNTFHWSFNSQSAWTDNTKATPLDLNGLSAGATGWLVVKANNTGNTTWYQTGPNQVDLATDRSAGRSSRFATGAWLSPSTPAKMDESSVAPGGTATFEFPIQVPAGAGTFDEYFNPVAQGITYLNDDVGQYFPITVQ